MKAKLYKTEKENYILVDPTKGTYDDGYTLGTSRESQYNKLSIKNCQAIENGYDLDELAKEHLGNPTEEELNKASSFVYALYKSNLLEFKKGFQKALEILGDKKFSLEQMLVAYNTNRSGTLFDQLINSFGGQQTEWDVEIEMEEVAIGDKYTPEPKPKLDADGCLILKLKSK
jgi:hypothetical protein